ncbi:MAG: hypothetical protein ACLPSF_08030 [Methylocella sp.]
MTSKTRKSAPARSAVLFGGMEALVCAAMVLSCAIFPCASLKAQTDAPAPAQGQQPAPAVAATPAPTLPAATATTSTAPAAQQRKKSKNPTGSPLDTLMSTRLLADVPEARDFVRQNRPSPETLDFKPTSGTDPKRPKPRTKTELDALRSELESAAQKNEERAGLRKPAGKAPKAPLN